MTIFPIPIQNPHYASGRRCLLLAAGAFWMAVPSCAGVKTDATAAGGGGIPATWKTGAVGNGAAMDSVALAKWWKQFRDPVLNELVAGALGSSPDIRTAYSKIAESRARRGVERAGLFPTLNAGASAQTSRNDTRGSAVNSSENYHAALDASWEIDLSGRRRLNVQAAGADLAQAAENFYSAQVSLSAEVAEAYVNLRGAEARLAVMENSLKSRAETVQLTQWKQQAGEGDLLESQQAVSILEQARASIPSLKQTIAQTRNQLSLLSGKAPGSLDALLSKSKPVPSAPVRIASGIPADTLRQRPDVRAAQWAVEAADARTKSARRERLPSLNLSGSLGLESLKAGKLFSPQTAAASILGSLTSPVFDAGRIRQNIVIQNEQTIQALNSYETTVLTALSEVENALIAVRRSNERLTILDKALSAAREAAVLARQQYQAGQTDLLTVLDSDRTLLGLEEQQVTTTADLASSHIQLYKAMGGGWSN